MPKRILHGEAMWHSDKLTLCAPKNIPEYAWLYPLADVNGSFELTNLQVLHGNCYSIRPGFPIEDLAACFADFNRVGLLFL